MVGQTYFAGESTVTDIEVLATGPEFVKEGVRGIEPVIEEILREASEEIQITAFVFTLKALHIFDLIQLAAERGVKVTIIVNNMEQQAPKVTSKMKQLALNYNHVKIMDFKGSDETPQLHAKVVVVDRKKAVVGSANFSWGGMYGNYEVGILVKGSHAWELAKIIDVLSLMK